MGGTIERWHEVARARDAAGLDALIAEDAVFLSPVVHTPQQGKAITRSIWPGALKILGNADFRYVEQWVGPSSAVLEFATTIDGDRGRGGRHHRLERRRPDRPVQGDDPAAEGDRDRPAEDGGRAGGVKGTRLGRRFRPRGWRPAIPGPESTFSEVCGAFSFLR